jgi:very-short-patch-repair endonuclease
LGGKRVWNWGIERVEKTKGWAKRRMAPFAKAFREQCKQGLSPWKNSASLLAKQKKIKKRRAKIVKRRDFAGHLLANQTKWEIIVGRVLTSNGIAFMRQKAFPFESAPHTRIVDFLIPDIYLALEVDGSQHYTDEGQRKDAYRTAQFAEEYPHIRFLRYSNFEVMAEGFEDRLARDIEAARAVSA